MVEEVAEIASCLLEILIFQRRFEPGGKGFRYHKMHYSLICC